MSDPFGDSNPMEGDVTQDLSDFVPPADNSGDFFEVEPHQEATGGAYEDQMHESYNDYAGESYQPMDFAPTSVEPPAVENSVQDSAFSSHTPAQIPVVEEDNELTKFMKEYEVKISMKAQEQEKVATECKAKAEEDMAHFLSERQRIKESKMQANRVFEQATLEKMVADLQNENPWERVVTLVDLETRKKKLDSLNNNKKDSKKQDPKPVAVPAKKTPEDEEDVSRMRQLFVQLKASPLEQTRADAVSAN
ncbi:clathrin light chain [Plasmopara halstedii]|uniref:Clathrin light chain n=1 Tax=Plasmopara halstedii TaxID=4781 RepID=A0A0P1AGV2_PLAHL|nr:clathrin light chain [Plasmopara halstedii]CEG40365.1 clathrin light chain [Plasmopara halstedii]|eukprot:XP_024576734.1 clathrin light chain [Plasmopara halstedii]